MATFKPFKVLMTATDEHGKFFPGFPNAHRPLICERRTGITCHVRPFADGTWHWNAYQQAAPRSGSKYAFSAYTCREQEGIVATFEEGQQIVTALYKQWMEERA